MKRVSRVIAILCLAMAVSLRAQTKLLPDRFGAWTTAPDPPGGGGGIGGSAQHDALYKEIGVTDLEQRSYSNGDKQLTVSLTALHDPSSAYELYTQGLHLGMKKWKAGKVSEANSDFAVALVGNLVLVVGNPSALPATEAQQLLDLLETKADQTPGPPIPTYLPVEGRVPGTERYTLGPQGFREAAESEGRPDIAALTESAGFTSGAEAMLARYKSGSQSAVLLLIEYPTPQLAELHLHHLEVALGNAPGQRGAANAAGSAERKGSLLSIVLGTSSAAYAASLRNAVNYETQVTWNEASQTATDPPITSTLVKIIIGTGVFMLMAVVLGIAFGGVRVLTKIFFPGKVFDRPEQMQILQLGLSGKTIDSRDFY